MSTDASGYYLVDEFDEAGLGLEGVLFADDFDPPAPPAATPAPQPAARALDEADLRAARAAGHAEGHAAALAAEETRLRGQAAEAGARLGACLEAARQSAGAAAAAASEGVARAMLQVLAALLPALCAEHGPREVEALASTLLPLLREEPRLSVRANPCAASLLKPLVDGCAGATLVADELLGEGDLIASWSHGGARRDSAVLLRAVTEALRPLGVTMPAGRPTVPASRHAVHTSAEFAHV